MSSTLENSLRNNEVIMKKIMKKNEVIIQEK
jgi:hypothetical protein